VQLPEPLHADATAQLGAKASAMRPASAARSPSCWSGVGVVIRR
jgi:hypothetical protein